MLGSMTSLLLVLCLAAPASSPAADLSGWFHAIHQALGFAESAAVQGCAPHRAAAQEWLARARKAEPPALQKPWAALRDRVVALSTLERDREGRAEALRADLHDRARADGLHHDPEWRQAWARCPAP